MTQGRGEIVCVREDDAPVVMQIEEAWRDGEATQVDAVRILGGRCTGGQPGRDATPLEQERPQARLDRLGIEQLSSTEQGPPHRRAV
jgi:hypothetical protein